MSHAEAAQGLAPVQALADYQARASHAEWRSDPVAGTMILGAGTENVVDLQAYRERRLQNSDERRRGAEAGLQSMVPVMVVPMTVPVPFGWIFNWAIIGIWTGN